MGKVKHGTAILDIGNGFIKVLVNQVPDTPNTPSARETFEGTIVTSKGMHASAIRKPAFLKKAIEHALQVTQGKIGTPIDSIYASISHPATQFIRKKKKHHLKRPMVFGENYMEQLVSRIQEQLQKDYPKYFFVTIEPISILIDGVDVTHTYQDSLARRSIEIEYGCLLYPNAILQAIQKILEPLVVEHAIIPSPLTTKTLISEEDCEIGAVVVDIGADVTNIAIWRRGVLIGARSLSAGGSSITNAIALALRVNVQEAERLKREYINKESPLPKIALQKALSTYRLSIAREIASYVKDIDTHKLFPGGITLIGGGSLFPEFPELLSDTVGLYTKIKKDIRVVTDTTTPPTIWNTSYALMCDAGGSHKKHKVVKDDGFFQRFMKFLSRVSDEVS